MNILFTNLIFLDVELTSRDDVFEFISNKMQSAGIVTDSASYVEALVAREKHSSTALGNNFAIPHGILESITKPAVCIVRLKDEILWEDLSDDPLPAEQVRVIFGIAMPSKQNEGDVNIHVDILSKLCTMLLDDEMCENILNCKTPEDVLHISQMFIK